jgi:hypothetical protein
MSRAADGKVMFGQYMPDLPANDNPGLTEALNVLPVDKFYRAYHPIVGSGTALSARPRGAIAAKDTSGNAYLYAGTATALYQRAGSAWTDKSPAPYTTGTDDYWRFVQFDANLIATNYAEVPQKITVGSGGNFGALATVGTAPRARQIGVVGRHVVLGDTIDGVNGTVPHRIQWSRIDVGTEWPVPNSADALAKQSGEQFMPSALGQVTGIAGNDQFGIVFQRAGVSRMTYIGGDLVYQFDVIDPTVGAVCPNGIVQVGNLVYFVASDGFYVTDGVSVKPVGASRFDRAFIEKFDSNYKHRLYGAIDSQSKLIYWAYPATGNTSGAPNEILIYNYSEDRITHADDDSDCLVTGLTTAVSLEDLDALFASIDDVTPPLDSPYWQGGNELMLGFTSDFKLGTFSNTPGVAVIDGQEAELNPGLMTYVDGIKPIVQDTAAITVSLGYRNNLSDAVTYSGDVTPTPRTGFADSRIEARYFRTRVKITGEFPSAQGVLYQARAMGAV